jgi:predicted dehydrogenase
MAHPPARNYAIAGAGTQSWYLLTACRALIEQGFNVTAICDPRLADAQARAREFGIPAVYKSYYTMLEQEEHLDGVLLPVPHLLHAEFAKEAMSLGLAVYGEKPMADSLASCQEMLDAASEHGSTFTVNYLYNDAAPWVEQQVSAGRIGNILGARVWWTRAKGIPAPPEFWNHPNAGILRDLFGHLVSMPSAMIPGEPIRVRATGSREAGVRSHGELFVAWDTIDAVVEHSTGAVVKIHGSWADGGPATEEIRMALYGDEGRIDYDFPGPRKDVSALVPVLRPDGGPAVFGPAPDVYITVATRMLGNWHRAALELEPLVFTGLDAYRIELELHAIGEATHTDGWVDIAA